MTTKKETPKEKGMAWLWGYHDNEYMIKLNTKQIERTIDVALAEQNKLIRQKVEDLKKIIYQEAKEGSKGDYKKRYLFYYQIEDLIEEQFKELIDE